MILPLTILIRESASGPPIEKDVGVCPETIVRIEDGVDNGTINMWCDGMDKPYTIRGTVLGTIQQINELTEPCGYEPCDQEAIDTE